MGRKFLVIKANNNTTGRMLRIARDKKINGENYSLIKSERYVNAPYFNHNINMAEARRLYPNGVTTEDRGGWMFYYAKGPSIYQYS